MCAATANAVATTAIAFLVAVITWRQWITNRLRLRHELFDRRFEIYEKLTGFLADTLAAGRVAPGAEIELLCQTKRAHFVFGSDTEIRSVISEIYRGAVNLHALSSEEENLSGDVLKKNIEDQRYIKNDFEVTLNSMENKFGKYLRLKD
jgi:hypothetical protein